MTLEQWGSVAEIIASLAVLVSLWFLVIELRRGLLQAKKEAWSEITLRRTETLKPLYENPQLASLIWRGFAQQPRLAPHEWARFSIFIYDVFVVFELSHKKFLDNDVSEAQFLSAADALEWWMRMPGVRAWWKTKPPGFSAEFCRFVDREMTRLEPDARTAQLAGASFLGAEADNAS
jgi:hypothetical protein